jgi:PAS domain S-box-containing protein
MDKDNDDNVRLKAKIATLEKLIHDFESENEILKLELEDVRKSLGKYQLISDFAHDWEMWYLPDGSIEYISPSFQTITGFAPQELISNPGLINSIVYSEDLEKYNVFINQSINFISIKQSLRFRILTLTKQLRWCEIKCKAVYDKRGKYLGQRASIGDITKLMEALGQIKDLSEGKQHETMAKQKYKRDLESKDRELVSFLMLISEKNETLQYVRRHVNNLLKDCNPDQKDLLTSIKDHLQTSLHSPDTWERFKLHFDSINPGFFERLSNKYPALTRKDIKICGYIKLGLSTKEISVLQSITFESAEISRVRLRRKLKLTRDINLVEFLEKI